MQNSVPSRRSDATTFGPSWMLLRGSAPIRSSCGCQSTESKKDQYHGVCQSTMIDDENLSSALHQSAPCKGSTDYHVLFDWSIVVALLQQTHVSRRVDFLPKAYIPHRYYGRQRRRAKTENGSMIADRFADMMIKLTSAKSRAHRLRYSTDKVLYDRKKMTDENSAHIRHDIGET